MITTSLLQDPANAGGIGTVTHWYRRWMDEHHRDHRELYLDDASRGGVLRLMRWDEETPAIPRVLPRSHVTPYWAARRKLRTLAATVEELHVIGASVLHGSLVPTGGPALVWFATLLADERRPVLHLQSPARRALYSSTLGPLSRVEASVLARADRIMAMSEHTADLVVGQGLAPASRVEVRPVPVDTDVFAPPGEGAERAGVLFMGRARDPRKGFDRLRRLGEVSGVVREQGVDVVSPGPPMSLSGGFRWVGRVDDPAAAYRGARLLALPSLQEGLGIVAFESLACGTPVVAYRCGGPDRLLERSGGAILVDDEASFRRAVELLLEDDAARQQLAVAGRQFAVENLSARGFLADPSVFSFAP